jgi:hypothetical protein
MEEEIVVWALENGTWAIRVRVKTDRDELIERRTVCHL